MPRIKRINMLTRERESWRPPLFSASTNSLSRFTFALRRLCDLQTSSIWNDLVKELPELRGTVVDVGCGAQPYRSLLRGAEYIGIDTTDAQSHFGYAQPDTRYFSGPRWPLEDGSVNFVLCTETLEHVLETSPFLNEAARCLAPGGRILLTVPFSARWHFIPYDYWRFTPSSLQHVLRNAGFTDLVVFARGNAVTVACYKVMALILRLLMPQNRGMLAGMGLRILSLPFLPFFLALAIVGNLSLLGDGGDDCLGYTVVAAKGPG